MKDIVENFNSIHEFLNVIESRKNNFVMRNKHSSERGDRSFTGSNSYSEAMQIFREGYKDVLPEIKRGVAKINQTQTVTRRHVQTNVVGYAPHVPNAIMGLPNSMIMTSQQPQKVKTISILAGICENCNIRAEEFIKSGVAVLGVINTLELRGYRVQLKVAFYQASAGEEAALGTIKLKDYREHLDLQKLCFPLAHPSMLRRFGFRWLETQPEIKDGSWSFGYGRQNDEVALRNCAENEFFIGLSKTREFDYDVDRIIESLKILKNNFQKCY